MQIVQPAWYCIRSHLKHEHIAAAHLREIPGVEVFLPQLRLLRLTRGNPVLVTEPLFPNYLFARFPLDPLLERVRHTPAVKVVVSFGEEVPAIPDAVIEELQQQLAEQAGEVYTDAPLAGEDVEIVAGPFQGAKGLVTRVLPAKQRVQLLLDVMGRAVSAELSLQLVWCKHRESTRTRLTSPTPETGLRSPTPLLAAPSPLGVRCLETAPGLA